MSIQLKVGKKYKDRNGKIIEITGKSDSTTYPFIGTNKHGYTEKYTSDGFYIIYETNVHDLVEEVFEGNSVVELVKQIEKLTGMKATLTLTPHEA